MSEYRCGYVDVHYMPADFSRASVDYSVRWGWPGCDWIIHPLIVRLAHGRLLPGASDGMTYRVCLAWGDLSEADAWGAASEEARIWCDQAGDEWEAEKHQMDCPECGAVIDDRDFESWSYQDNCCRECWLKLSEEACDE